MAMDAYSAMRQTEDPGKLKRIRKALFAYCKIDTLGMVKIVEKLKEFSSEKNT